MSTPPEWVQAWIEAQRQAVERWSGLPHAEAGGPLADFIAHFTAKPGDTSAPGPGFGTAAQIPGWWRSFIPADAPGLGGHAGGLANGAGAHIGPLRESLQLVESLAQALSRQQKLSADLMAVLAAIHRETLDLLARRILEQNNSGVPVTDFKGLYDLWVECGETTYGKVAGGEAYSRLQAELTNAAVAVQSLQQQLLERWLKQLDLPTRSELNTLHRRVLDLQRRLDAAQPEVRTAEVAPPAKRRSQRKQVKR